MMITSSNAAIVTSINIPDSSISNILGFNQNSVNPFVGGILLSVYVINLNESDMVYVNSSIISSQYNDATNSSSNTLAIMYTGSF